MIRQNENKWRVLTTFYPKRKNLPFRLGEKTFWDIKQHLKKNRRNYTDMIKCYEKSYKLHVVRNTLKANNNFIKLFYLFVWFRTNKIHPGNLRSKLRHLCTLLSIDDFWFWFEMSNFFLKMPPPFNPLFVGRQSEKNVCPVLSLHYQ